GIRDRNVTGVQTCALPICQHADSRRNRQAILSKIEAIKLLFVNVNNCSILSRYSVYSARLGLWRSGHHSSVVKRNINIGAEAEENSAQDDTHKNYFGELVSCNDHQSLSAPSYCITPI